MEDLNVFVLAAGKSQRIQSVVKGIPKPLIKIGESSVLENNLRLIIKQGFKNIWINLHFQAELIKATVEDMNLAATINYSYEKVILGTAGAVKNIQTKITGPLLVVYGDSLLSFEIARLISEHKKSGAEITIAAFDRKSSKHTGIAGGGIEVDEDLNIISFLEGGEHQDKLLINAGIYLINPKIIDQIPSGKFYDFSIDLFPQLIKKKFPIKVYKFKNDEYCLGIDTPDNLIIATKYMENGLLR
jgi:NDP-sugar pyrophosphorylase family protein